jgi:hypothetical protein
LDPVEIETSQGLARAHIAPAAAARGALVLGHGAGGGVGAPDLRAATAAALDHRFSAVLVEQPYRVAGRRAPAPAPRLDAAWIEVMDWLGQNLLAELPLVSGGRSMGARVACRTASQTGVAGVLCLAFPLLPPRRAASAKEPRSRLDELESVAVEVLVVQGRGDPFGMPPPGPARAVVQVDGNHSLRSDLPAVGAAVGDWLSTVL